MLEKVKLALRIKTDAFDDELEDLIAAGVRDLGIAGLLDSVLVEPVADPLIIRVVVTYCKLHFGEPDDPERLQRSYDAQKAQLMSATGYTDWGKD